MIINLKDYQLETFFEICRDLDMEFQEIAYNRYRILKKSLTEYKLVKDYIGDCPVKASVVYSLYTTGCLIVRNHRYPSIDIWRSENPGMTLDHKLPKSKFPRLTFDISNWQPLTERENKTKGNKVSKKDCLQRLEIESYRSCKMIDNLIESLLV